MASISSKSHLMKNSFSIENLLAKPHHLNKHEILENHEDNFKLTQENIQKFNDFQNNNNVVKNQTESMSVTETISVKSSNKIFGNPIKKIDYDQNGDNNKIFENRIFYENGKLNGDDPKNGLRTPDSSFTDENMDTSSEYGSMF